MDDAFAAGRLFLALELSMCILKDTKFDKVLSWRLFGINSVASSGRAVRAAVFFEKNIVRRKPPRLRTVLRLEKSRRAASVVATDIMKLSMEKFFKTASNDIGKRADKSAAERWRMKMAQQAGWRQILGKCIDIVKRYHLLTRGSVAQTGVHGWRLA